VGKALIPVIGPVDVGMDSREPLVVICGPEQASQKVFWRLTGLVKICSTREPLQVPAVLEEVAQEVESGRYAAGFVSYEAAPGLDPALKTLPPGPLPTAWFGVFERMETFGQLPLWRGDGLEVLSIRPSLSAEGYRERWQKIHAYLAEGHTYQTNLTFPLFVRLGGTPEDWFSRLYEAQPTSFAAFIRTEEFVIVSVSPELFFRVEGGRVVCRPMKGTARRGRWCQEDLSQRARLAESPKDRAENAMIVDMVRNDLARIAAPGSVRVTAAFVVEQYPTVWQMTSTVEATTNAPMVEIFKALFPPASVTGAPKVRTMEILCELEIAPRGVYTGAIGWFLPQRRCQFAVAIRTLWWHQSMQEAVYSVGSGVVWDSTAEAEYEECLRKAAVLATRPQVFELFTTILWDGAQLFLLEKHMERLERSAEYFGFPFSVTSAQALLEKLLEPCRGVRRRVRLFVGRSGRLRADVSPILPLTREETVPVRLAAVPIDPANVLLYHKTTARQMYQEMGIYPDAVDVILWNPQGQVTETTLANLVVEIGGKRFTPPIECGLLPGVFRQYLLESGQVAERVVTVEELRRADRLYAVNALRGWIPLRLLPGDPLQEVGQGNSKAP
jgi:para-aminobenzoate synthetase/4-amino-4-deoxychorismate lyase